MPPAYTFKFSNIEEIRFLIRDTDLAAQLRAIRNLLGCNQQADAALSRSIERIDERAQNASGDYAYHLEGVMTDKVYESVFQDAAHSMAALGMLAPFVESLFAKIFRGLRDHATASVLPPAKNPRMRALQDEYWDPHYYFGRSGKREDIVEGITQLASSIGLANFLPQDYKTTLTALFAYRNKMFHFGLEWPTDERAKFETRISKARWNADWFTKSTYGGKAWIFYMSADFIEHCLETIDKIFDGVASFLEHQRGNSV